MTATLDLFDLDKQVARAAASAERARRAYAETESPLENFRAVSGMRILETLNELAPAAIEAPVRDGLRTWITELLTERLSYEARRALVLARALPRVISPSAPTTLVSWDDAWLALLGENAAGAASWLAALRDCGPQMAGANREARSRLGEVAARIDEKLVRFPGELWEQRNLPLPRARSAALAEAVLRATDDLSRQLESEARRRGEWNDGVASAITASLARDATSTFPARVRPQWLEDVFGAHLAGLKLALVLPSRVFGGATFARALGAFGHALRIATSAKELPFVLRASPRSLDAERFGVVFAALAADRVFLRSVVGATAIRAKRDERTMAWSLLLAARTRAIRVLLSAEPSRFAELTDRVFGATFPKGLEGAWPIPKDSDDGALVATVEAGAITAALVEQFDEDWFKNPRAFEWIRARGSMPLTSFDRAALVLERGEAEVARSLAARFERALG